MPKKDNHLIEIIKQSAQSLLECGQDYSIMKKATEQMYQTFSSITGITIDGLSNDTDVLLPSGKAIGSAGAAHCLLEMQRTAVFLRGIHKAILRKQVEKRAETLNILYAGCGPYGTLIVPLLLLHKPGKLKVDLVEINPGSLAAIQKTINALDLNAYIDKIYGTDATHLTIEKPYDIAVSETMQACLKKEPQVAIMQNLVPQLPPQTIFIPEEISVDAFLTNPKKEQEQLLYQGKKVGKPPRISLGNVLVINKNHLATTSNKQKINIPAQTNGCYALTLFTTVKVFENEVLKERESSITLPVNLYDLRPQESREITFRYIQGKMPHIESYIEENTHASNK